MNKWINGLRYMMDYEKKNLTSEVEQRWDFRTRAWNNAVRNLFSYDDEGEIKQMVEERWNKDVSDWETKNVFIYSDLKEIEQQMPQ